MQSKCTIHRCRFVDWKPESITCLAFDPEGEKLAAGRGNGDIEIWNVVSSFLCDQVTAGSSAAVPNALAWAPRSTAFPESRLFSAGFAPQIVEWDLVTLLPKNSCDSYGGVVWALQVDPTGTLLAAGCDDGCVRLFSIDNSDGSIQLTRSFDRVHGRILSVAWDPVGPGIMGGSSDGSIRRWNLETAATEYRIRMDRQEREDKAPVWTLLALRDGTLVSGTSAGLVQFWDATMGTLCKSFKGHSADVLALAANQSQTLLFSGGVDGQVLQYSLSAPDAPITDADRWAFSAKRRLHTHDVRALSCLGNHLASGGLDTILFVSKVDMFTELPPRNILPLPHRPLASLARPSKLLLVQATSSLHVWSLSGGLEASGRNGIVSNGLHAVSPEHPRLLAQINVKGESNLRCSAISPNGAFIACSSTTELKLFRLSQPTTTPTDAPLHVRKAKLPQKLGGAARLLFTPDSKRLVVGALDGRIHVVDVEEVTLLRSFPHHQARHAMAMQRESGSGPAKAGSLWSLAVSPDGQWLASGDSANNIHVFHLDSLQHHVRVPSVETSHTALCFHSDNRTLAIVSCTRHLYLYDVESHQLHHWTRGHHLELPRNFWKHTGHVASATFHPTRPDLLLMVSQKWFCTINLDLHPSLAQPLLLEQGKDESDAATFKRTPKRRKAINADVGTLTTPASAKHVTSSTSEAAGPSATAKGKQRATVGDTNRTAAGPKPTANGTGHAGSDSESDSNSEEGEGTGSKAPPNAVRAGGKKRRKARDSVLAPAPSTPTPMPDDSQSLRRSGTATSNAASSKRNRASKAAAADTEGTAADEGAEGGGGEVASGSPQQRNLMFNRPPLLFVDFLGPTDLFVMERPWEDVVAQLPPALSTHRFGT